MLRTKILILIISPLHSFLIAQTFTEQSQNLGVNGVYGISSSEGGGGISVADFNGDGLNDLSLATADGLEPIFYTNEGTHFELVSPNYIDHAGETKQILWVDYDADGDKDIYITSENSDNRLYKNTGNLNFIDVTAAVGLPTSTATNFGANFGDLDFDGNLELYLTNYGSYNSLYSYNPNSDQFIDITSTALVDNGMQHSFDCIFFDSDLDGDLDIYVINDKAGDENALYMNMGGNVFIDISVPSGTNIDLFCMNAGVGDYNLDGLLDIYITSQEDAVLLENQGNNLYTNVASSAGVELDGWAWTGNFLDYDNDNDLDLYACVEFSDTNRPNPFYVNNGNETFDEPYLLSGGITGGDNLSSFVNAVADFDNNGNLDLVSYMAESLGVNIFLNNEQNDAFSFKLDLEGINAHPEAWGAFVEVHFTDGTKIVTHKQCSESFLSQNSEFLHFGVKQNQVIDFIKVKWPANSADEIINGNLVTLNTTHKIVEGSGITESSEYKVCINTGELLINPLTSLNMGAANNLEYKGTVLSNCNSSLSAENEVFLNKGFETKLGAIFEVKIDVCDN